MILSHLSSYYNTENKAKKYYKSYTVITVVKHHTRKKPRMSLFILNNLTLKEDDTIKNADVTPNGSS